MLTSALESTNGLTKPAIGLARDSYFSSEVYDREIRRVLHRQWLLVGHVSSVRAPGDFFEKQVGPESMILVRDAEGALRAFFNVCRHRGYRLVDADACGSARGFVCPYHRWSYELSGRLRRVPGSMNGQDFDFADYPLHEARCEVFAGFIYVWLGEEEPAPLAAVLGPVSDSRALALVKPEKLKPVHRETYVIEANWKSMMENDMECYHCGHGGHPSLSVSCDFQGFFLDKRDPTQHFPLRPGMKTFSIDGERVCSRSLGSAEDGFSTGFILWPFFCGPVFFVDHAVSLELTPMGPSRSLFVCEWFVHQDSVEGKDYDVARLIEVFHLTNLEDKAFGERNYHGLRSARFTPGPLHPRREDGVIEAHRLYLDMMERA